MEQAQKADFLKLEEEYWDNPKSRGFAPLAGHYLDLGHVDRAIRILKEGMKHHPEFILGHLVYAECLQEIQEWERAYRQLASRVESNPYNLKLLDLMAKSCEKTGRLDECKLYLDRLVYLAPQREDFSLRLEEINRSFSQDEEALELSAAYKEDIQDGRYFKVQKFEAPEIELEDSASSQLELASSEWSMEKSSEFSGSTSTFSVVDEFVSQGRQQEAEELLENIIRANPDDDFAKSKLDEVKKSSEETKDQLESFLSKIRSRASHRSLDL